MRCKSLHRCEAHVLVEPTLSSELRVVECGTPRKRASENMDRATWTVPSAHPVT